MDYILTQTGGEVQQLLDQVTPNEQSIAAETERATLAEQAETERAQGAEANLQQQINDIISGDANVSLTASPSAVFVGEESTIDLVASTNTSATQIVIKKEGETVATGTGTGIIAQDTVTPEAVEKIFYSADFAIAGNIRTANRSVSAVVPLFYGVGAEYPAEMTKDNTPRVAGSFNYTDITTDGGDYLFFEIPEGMSLTALALVSAPADTSLSFEQIESQREGYKAYKNVEPRGAGTYTYKLTLIND